jgi:hypothetical protein
LESKSIYLEHPDAADKFVEDAARSMMEATYHDPLWCARLMTPSLTRELLRRSVVMEEHLCAQCEALGITDLAAPLKRALALCEAKLGDHVTAARRLDALIASRAHCRPSFRATDYEARARVAIWAKDAALAKQFVKLATSPDGVKVWSQAQRGRLIDEAQRSGLALDIPESHFEPDVEVPAGVRPVTTTLQQQLASLDLLHDSAARAQHVLELLADAAGVCAGYLYYARDTSLVRAAMLHVEGDVSLDAFASAYVRQQLQRTEMTTVFNAATDVEAWASTSWTSQAGNRYRIGLLRCRGGNACVGLVALLGGTDTASSTDYHALSHTLSTRLLALGDVTAIDAG